MWLSLSLDDFCFVEDACDCDCDVWFGVVLPRTFIPGMRYISYSRFFAYDLIAMCILSH